MSTMFSYSDKKWYAIRTKFKCEKFVCDLLMKKDIEAYVPLIEKKKRYTRKVKTYQLPLIHCYAFVNISRHDYLKVLQTQYVMDFLRIGGEMISIPVHEMQLLKRVVGETYEVEAEPRSWKKGDMVEIIGGNLTGLKGTLLEKSGKKFFLVDLETIGYHLNVVIEDKLMRKLSKSAAIAL